MGREIRKVPKGWEHSRDQHGKYKPMFEEPYIDALKEWKQNDRLWKLGKHPDQINYPEGTKDCTYADWAGDIPRKAYYNPSKWSDEQANCYQMYENVSEGTPVSPVFEQLKDLEDWLVETKGYDRSYAKQFCEEGSAPTFVAQVSIDNALTGSIPNLPIKPRIRAVKSKKRKGPGF